ncbi:hypothetical protein [Geodermatophilus sabuli]|uniref:DUF5666 domain-containing protein n=1 Tax=Geodermatophilus sabuli TaxID=1564158 RepID=A0A285EC31_9ACTN|nr:hypothetical protein [Geodermatophilus sabuli]MBB3084956.1 hypothetical protein [Geodermatophilus sabuli]SNX95636.1 hypothetical protein SAMN06893097_102336 [Geodermatophilus sabuli]
MQHRSRLLLVVPAATALVFTGISPALAGGGDGHHDDDAWAKVVDINDEAELGDDGDELDVTFTYECDDDDDEYDISADVTAKNRHEDIRYEGDKALDCNGEENEITVTLEKKDEAAEEGDWVKVTVTINDDDDELAEESEWVEVVDDDNGDDKDNGDDDKDDDKGKGH